MIPDFEYLSPQEFDIVATGEFTHFVLWIESVLEEIIATHFVASTAKQSDFVRLVLRPEGISTIHRIGIVKGILDSLDLTETDAKKWKAALNGAEKVIRRRNVLSHGIGLGPNPYPAKGVLKIKLASRSGKYRILEISADQYRHIRASASSNITALQELRKLTFGF